MVNCSHCFHPKENHKPVEGYENYHICTGSLECRCEKYEEPISDFINTINATVVHFKGVESKVKYILEKIPNLRNSGSKSFPRAYKKLVYNINQNEAIPKGLWKTIPADDTITRAKRHVQQHNPGLVKFDINKIRKDMAVQQGILEWVTSFGD